MENDNIFIKNFNDVIFQIWCIFLVEANVSVKRSSDDVIRSTKSLVLDGNKVKAGDAIAYSINNEVSVLKL